MHHLHSTACFLALTFAGGSAFAQGPTAPAAPAATPAPVVTLAGQPESTPTAAPAEAAGPTATPAPSGGIACVVGDHPQEFPDSARTATGLVCDALRERGVAVGTPAFSAGTARAAYVVHLDQLGSAFFLRVNYEEPVGTVRKTRRLSISELPEAEVVAPRLAQALLDGKNVKETIDYENVAGSEARNYKKKRGEFVIGGGIAALTLVGSGDFMRPTLNFFGFYETREWGLGLQLHVGDFGSDSEHEGSFTAFSVGGRYFFNEQNITPFIGAGLTLSSIEERASADNINVVRQGNGTSLFGEVGVEFFRLHSTHLIVSLRADAPFYTLKQKSYDDYSCLGCVDPLPTGSDEKKYDIPILLNVGIGF